MKWLLSLIDAFMASLYPPNPKPMPEPIPEPQNAPPEPVPPQKVSKSTLIYETAKKLIGQHLTLNESVAPEVGCAEAVSFVLKQAGYPIPSTGIASTTTMYMWLPKNGFARVVSPLVGDIICSPTGLGNGKIPGHVGCIAQYGILSNDSNSGLFLELWTLEKWVKYYGEYGGLPVAFFRAVDKPLA